MASSISFIYILYRTSNNGTPNDRLQRRWDVIVASLTWFEYEGQWNNLETNDDDDDDDDGLP